MKYVLCRPEGGLNDMFVQIAKCYEYCLRYGRTLLVDTNLNDSFKDDFSFYFKSESDILKINNYEIKDILYVLKSCNAECYPNINYIDHISNYSSYYNNFISDENHLPITFDFNNWYHETLLIHDACGGGIPNFILFDKLKISDYLKNIFNDRLSQVENFCNTKNYNAIHIRNTDMKCSDIDNFINSLPNDHFFISTDDIYSLNKIKSLYNVISLSSIPNVNCSLHLDIVDSNEKRKRNIDSIIDLMLLAFSNNIIGSTHNSGYFILAQNLKNNGIIYNFL